MDFTPFIQAVTALKSGTITPEVISLVINILLLVLGYFFNKVLKKETLNALVKEKMIVAEKAISSSMFDDNGKYNQAKEDLALMLIKVAVPKLTPGLEANIRKTISLTCETAKLDLEKNKAAIPTPEVKAEVTQ